MRVFAEFSGETSIEPSNLLSLLGYCFKYLTFKMRRPKPAMMQFNVIQGIDDQLKNVAPM